MLPSRYKILNRKHNENKATKRAQSAFKSTSDIVTYDYRSTRAISIIVSTVTGVTVRELSIRLQSLVELRARSFPRGRCDSRSLRQCACLQPTSPYLRASSLATSLFWQATGRNGEQSSLTSVGTSRLLDVRDCENFMPEKSRDAICQYFV